MIIVKYVSVKVSISVPEASPHDSQNEIAEMAINECDYNFTYDEDDAKILNTEIICIQDHAPIGS